MVQSNFEVLFKENFVFPTLRTSKYQLVEFVSSIGGILGLFVGCSLLSVIEFFYYFGIHLVLNQINKAKKVSSIEIESLENIQSKLKSTSKSQIIINFLREYLENSTVHSAPHIAKKNVVVK